MIELTQQQHDALCQNGTEPARVLDRAANVEYVLVRAEVFDRLRAVLDDGTSDAAALMNEAMADDDEHDPYLEHYRRLAEQSP